MNREFKFRVWDNKNKKFQYNFYIDCRWSFLNGPYCATVIREENGDFSFSLDDKQNTYIISQYIGIQDCEGNDIFEGDILEIYGIESYYPLTANKNIKFKRIIEYNKFVNCGCCSDVCGIGFDFKNNFPIEDKDYNKLIKIIGNIYENPELL